MPTADHAPEAAAVLSTQQLTKSYDDTTVVDHLDLAVPRNSIYGFLGPNGAGKTTTMKMLLGLIRPTSGSGSILGLDIRTESPELRRHVGYLPQEPRFYPHMTARQTLRFAADFFYTGPAPAIERRIEDMLELVGMIAKSDRPVRTLSGGEMQRLGIAQAQIHEPALLILDEPAAALDPLGRRDVLAILERLRSTTTVFYSTHILDDVQRVSDSVCILKQGRMIRQGPLAEILATDGAVWVAEVSGDVAAARERLLAEPWIDSVVTEDSAAAGGSASGSARADGATATGTATLRITVTDDDIARARLQRILLADDDLIVSAFGRHTGNLEDIFVGLVEGDQGSAPDQPPPATPDQSSGEERP